MKMVTFQQKDDRQQIGALSGGDCCIVLLQAGSELMDGASSPFFTDMLAFLRNGAAVREKAQAVIEYVIGQDAPDRWCQQKVARSRAWSSSAGRPPAKSWRS